MLQKQGRIFYPVQLFKYSIYTISAYYIYSFKECNKLTKIASKKGNFCFQKNFI